MKAIQIVTTFALLACFAANAAKPPPAKGKKLYCWNQNGQKICGDALPPEAADAARTEISAKSGLQLGTVARALTPEERAAADTTAEQTQVAADAAAIRQRRDLAMVESYATEADLRHAYGERIGLLDDSLKTSALGEANLRLSLASLLSQASDLELMGKKVPPYLIGSVRREHAQLQRQQRILAQQQRDREELDGDFSDAVSRYRTLKAAQAPAPDATVAPAPPPTTPAPHG
jgi:hypothetical protein